MTYIYTITNQVNQKMYVGLTRKDNPYERWKKHIDDSKYRPEYPIHKAIKKYGVDNFKFRVIEECNDNIAEEREIHYIQKYNSFYQGYNATLGGRIRYDTESKPISRYSKSGEIIDHFASVRDASIAVNGDEGAIGKCANGKRFSAYGYRWSWKDQTLPVIEKYFTPLYGYNIHGDYKEWISTKEAAKDLNCDRRRISSSINSSKDNKYQVKGWYLFKLTDEKIDFDDITFAQRYRPDSKKAREMGKIRSKQMWG